MDTPDVRIAIPHWQGRVSPVLDVAGVLLLVDWDGEGATSRQSVLLRYESLPARVREISELGISVLICGAISMPLELALNSAGIEIISQRCGEIEEVLGAYLAGRLRRGEFLMPGCCGRRRCRGDRKSRGGKHKSPEGT